MVLSCSGKASYISHNVQRDKIAWAVLSVPLVYLFEVAVLLSSLSLVYYLLAVAV